MTPDEVRETVELLRRRERMKFELGLHIGMAIGFGTCAIVLFLYWAVK